MSVTKYCGCKEGACIRYARRATGVFEIRFIRRVINMNNYLLIGNGLNRCLPDGIPWGNLLKNIADKYSVSYDPNITMPLEFERIVNEYLDSNPSIDAPASVIHDIKCEIANIIGKVNLQEGAIHYRLNGLDLNGILTTNYDVLIEKAFDEEYIYDGSTSKKYLFEKTGVVNTKQFYHLHGIANCAPSLCLGYEHYMGMVEHLRRNLNAKKNNISTEMAIKRILFEEEPAKETWGELFYTSNIGIIGLELSESESDIWWLITHRASLYYSDYCSLRSDGRLSNTIVYYDILDEEKKDKPEDEEKRIYTEFAKKNKHKLLKNEHIEVKTVAIGSECKSYKEAYTLIIEDIRKNGMFSRGSEQSSR